MLGLQNGPLNLTSKCLFNFVFVFFFPAVPRPKSTFTKDVAQTQSIDIVQKVVDDVVNDEFVNAADLEHSSAVKQVADSCKAAFASLPIALYIQQVAIIFDLLWPAIDAADRHTLGSQRRQAMYSGFQRIRNSDAFIEAVEKFTRTITGMADITVFFTQMFSRKLFEDLMLLHEKCDGPAAADEQYNLSSKEENAVRYTAGYIVSRLPSKLKKVKECSASQVDRVVKNMTDGHDKDTRLNYTKEWVYVQTRGGLT